MKCVSEPCATGHDRSSRLVAGPPTRVHLKGWGVEYTTGTHPGLAQNHILVLCRGPKAAGALVARVPAHWEPGGEGVRDHHWPEPGLEEHTAPYAVCLLRAQNMFPAAPTLPTGSSPTSLWLRGKAGLRAERRIHRTKMLPFQPTSYCGDSGSARTFFTSGEPPHWLLKPMALNGRRAGVGCPSCV